MKFGVLKSLFAGNPANLAYFFLSVGRHLGMNMVVERLASRLGPPSDSGFMRDTKSFLLENAGRL